MVQVNLVEPYALVNFVKVNSISVDPVFNRVFAAVFYYCFVDGTELPVIPLRYNNQNFGYINPTATVVLVGGDYVGYNNYINQGKTPEQAVLQVLLDRNVISGVLV